MGKILRCYAHYVPVGDLYEVAVKVPKDAEVKIKTEPELEFVRSRAFTHFADEGNIDRYYVYKATTDKVKFTVIVDGEEAVVTAEKPKEEEEEEKEEPEKPALVVLEE